MHIYIYIYDIWQTNWPTNFIKPHMYINVYQCISWYMMVYVIGAKVKSLCRKQRLMVQRLSQILALRA